MAACWKSTDDPREESSLSTLSLMTQRGPYQWGPLRGPYHWKMQRGPYDCKT